MYIDDLNREAAVFARGLGYILEDAAKFFRRVAAALGLRA